MAGNRALRENLRRQKLNGHDGRVLGLFCFDGAFLARQDFSHNRFAFFIDTLESLRKELRAVGGDLLVVDAMAQEAFPKILKHLKKDQKLDLVSWGRDYEPFARARDKKISDLLKKEKVEAFEGRDHLLLEPEEIFKTKPGEFYQVYSPFAKKWFDQMGTPEIQKRLEDQNAGFDYLEKRSKAKVFKLQWSDVLTPPFPLKESLEKFKKENAKNVTIPLPPAGSPAAFQTLKDFSKKIKDYKKDRDIPCIEGTSRFSMYLKNGSLTSAQIIQYLGLGRANFAADNGPTRFLKEIVWREFYYHILYHRPDVEKHAFLEKFRDIPWPNDKKLFKRWCEGTTGFPIVDAGMRQLNTTGWMHNRVRMIVASFLAKDLLIDWRWGENYFMKMLLDGDLAPNNGGWQWAASTGCDPQPYFRIFNPWLQSEKFDPEGKYIKTYIPELKNTPTKNLHKPDADRGPAYPEPIVDHSYQKRFALKLYGG